MFLCAALLAFLFNGEPLCSTLGGQAQALLHCCAYPSSILMRLTPVRCNAGSRPQHPWLVKHGVASDKPLPSIVVERMKQFAAMTKLKKVRP